MKTKIKVYLATEQEGGGFWVFVFSLVVITSICKTAGFIA
jgi:hypothetical protein